MLTITGPAPPIAAGGGMLCARATPRALTARSVPACTRALRGVQGARTARPGRGAPCASSGRDTLELFSPAKINLFLRIIRRREDGFHDLASLFHVIDLGDRMTFELIDDDFDRLACDMPGVPTDGSNLVIRALDLFRSKTGIKQSFDVDLTKIVPHGAGMGGGSGNAATAMWAANELCGRPASTEDLLEWSGDIGSDISVFFSTGAAYCTGRGEIVENVAPPIDLATPMLLVKPPYGCSTPAIFKALDLDARSTANPLDLLSSMQAGVMDDSVVVNDLEQPAFDVVPELKALKARIAAEGDFKAVFMTGSGSTIVGMGSEAVPAFVKESPELFVSPARLIVREEDGWYQAPSRASDPLEEYCEDNPETDECRVYD